MRIWQNFREPRTAFAMASALMALAFGALELRTLFADALAGARSSDPLLASAMAVGIVSLAGAVVALGSLAARSGSLASSGERTCTVCPPTVSSFFGAAAA